MVLGDESGLGKSRWCRLQCSEHEFLEVDCAGKAHLNLRGLKSPGHTHCLLDEATPTLILENKNVVRAGPAPRTLGASATGMHQYTVFAFMLRCIATSSNWMELVSALKSGADKRWLHANSVYYRCEQRLC